MKNILLLWAASVGLSCAAVTTHNIVLAITYIDYAAPTENYTLSSSAIGSTDGSKIILVSVGLDSLPDSGGITQVTTFLTFTLGSSASTFWKPANAFDIGNVTANSYGASPVASPVNILSYLQQRYNAGDDIAYLELRPTTGDIEITSTFGAAVAGGSGTPAAQIKFDSSIPEPGVAALAAIGALGAVRRRR